MLFFFASESRQQSFDESVRGSAGRDHPRPNRPFSNEDQDGDD